MTATRILFTGATSFTGMWFIRKLAADGHHVTAAIRRAEKAYTGLRLERLETLRSQCQMHWNVPFGTPDFLELIAQNGPFDVLCHHAAEVSDYKSPDFEIEAAVAANTHALPAVLDRLYQTGCHRVVLSGSVFEEDEGAGTMPLRAFSPYGMSKTLTGKIFQRETGTRGMALGKFVIANPFGPYEEPRFTQYLMRCWKDGRPAKVNTPDYLRDNIPVTLLAKTYARFAGDLPQAGFNRITPSCYAETQGAFARRFAAEMGSRLQIDAALELATQDDFSEPLARTGIDAVLTPDIDWSEKGFWDDAARYYAAAMNIPLRHQPEQSTWRTP